MTSPDRLDRIADRLDKIAEDVAVMRERTEYLREAVQSDGASIREHNRRIGALEAWRWRLVGAATVLGAGAGAFGGPIWEAIAK